MTFKFFYGFDPLRSEVATNFFLSIICADQRPSSLRGAGRRGHFKPAFGDELTEFGLEDLAGLLVLRGNL